MKSYKSSEWMGDAVRHQEAQELADYHDAIVMVRFDFMTGSYLVALVKEWQQIDMTPYKNSQVSAVLAPRSVLPEALR